jgi:serine/threonine protein kinase
MPLDDEWDESGAQAPVPTKPPPAARPRPPSEPPEGTLRALTDGKRLDPRRALLIIRQVLQALAEIHARGGVHGDVKPENIRILPGLGETRIELVLASTLAGDPVYRAPEAALGGIDALGDIYATGAVLFDLLTAHPPFFADDPEALRRLHAYAPMQKLEQRVPDLEFADLLEPIVATALEKKRDARYQSAKDMIAALDPALQAIEEAAARPAGGAERRRKPNDSLLLLAKDLMPRAQDRTSEPLVPANVAREVPKLSLTSRAELRARKVMARLPVDRVTARQKQIALAVVGVVVLLLVVLVTCGGHHHKPATPTVPAAAPTTKSPPPTEPAGDYWRGTETR